jgi:hypothetical protein
MKWKVVLVLAAVVLLLAVPAALTWGAQMGPGITSPSGGESVRGEVTIMGTATDPSFEKYEMHYGPDPWIPIGENPYSEQVTDGELGVWDTTEVNDGSYTLRLRIVRTDGNYDDYTVSVEVVNTQPVATEPPPAAEEPTEEAAEPTEEAAEPTAEATEEAAEPTEEAEEPAEEAEAPAAEGGAPEIPFLDMWAGSGHADSEAEAFRHWDEDDPPEIRPPARTATARRATRTISAPTAARCGWWTNQ